MPDVSTRCGIVDIKLGFFDVKVADFVAVKVTFHFDFDHRLMLEENVALAHWDATANGWAALRLPKYTLAFQHATHVTVIELAGRRSIVHPKVADHRSDFTAEVIAAGYELPALGGGERLHQTFLRELHAVELRIQLFRQGNFF